MMILAGIVWIAVSSHFALQGVPAIGPAEAASLSQYMFLIFPLFGLFIIVPALLRLATRRHAVIDERGVAVEGGSLFSRERWSLPLTEYAGVRHRTGVIRRKNSSTTYQIIELAHDDSDKDVLLWVERGHNVPRARWEDYARRLNVPALSADNVQRDSADLDKSLRQLAQEGKVQVAYDPAQAVPAGLELRRGQAHGDDVLEVIIHAPRVPRVFIVIFAAAFFVAGIAAFAGGQILGSIIVLAVCAGIVWLHRHDTSHQRVIKLTRDALLYDDAWHRTDSGSQRRMRLDEIEQVHLSEKGRELIIAADSGQIKTGGGLSREALIWLKDYLSAAILHA